MVIVPAVKHQDGASALATPRARVLALLFLLLQHLRRCASTSSFLPADVDANFLEAASSLESYAATAAAAALAAAESPSEAAKALGKATSSGQYVDERQRDQDGLTAWDRMARDRLVHNLHNTSNSTDTDPASLDHIDWWEGDLMRMSWRKIFAIADDLIVMCYGEAKGGGCKVAPGNLDARPLMLEGGESTNEKSAEAMAADPRLLPTVNWGEEWRFESQIGIKHVEAVRLRPNAVALCFERVERSSLACGVATIVPCTVAGFQDCSKLDGQILELGEGRLESMSVLEAGKRVGACYRPIMEAQATSRVVLCPWMEVDWNDAGDSDRGKGVPVPRWSTDLPLEVDLEAFSEI